MKLCIWLCILCLFTWSLEDKGMDKDQQPELSGHYERVNQALMCKKPRGKIGQIRRDGCLVFTCTKKNRKKAIWKETFDSKSCCAYQEVNFKIGENITRGVCNLQCVKHENGLAELDMAQDPEGRTEEKPTNYKSLQVSGISAKDDIISSANFPSSYENNIEATHFISVLPRHYLSIHFIEFDLEYESNCGYDSFKIVDTSGKDLFFGCGQMHGKSVPAAKKFPSLIKTSLGVTITFKTDGSVTKKGFQIKVQQLIADYSVEVYYPESDIWREATPLPRYYFNVGRFITFGKTLLYAGGWADNGIYQLNKEGDSWIWIKNMTDWKILFPILVISEAECYGVSYSQDLKTASVSGSMLEILETLTNASPEEVDVACCKNGVHVMFKCGNGTSCDNICGENTEGHVNLAITEEGADSSVCPKTNKRGYGIYNTPIYKISYCPSRVRNIGQLDRNRVCCLHPSVYYRPGFKARCCTYGLCF